MHKHNWGYWLELSKELKAASKDLRHEDSDASSELHTLYILARKTFEDTKLYGAGHGISRTSAEVFHICHDNVLSRAAWHITVEAESLARGRAHD